MCVCLCLLEEGEKRCGQGIRGTQRGENKSRKVSGDLRGELNGKHLAYHHRAACKRDTCLEVYLYV